MAANDKAWEHLRNIERALVDRIAGLPDAELLAELVEDSIELEANAARMRSIVRK